MAAEASIIPGRDLGHDVRLHFAQALGDLHSLFRVLGPWTTQRRTMQVLCEPRASGDPPMIFMSAACHEPSSVNTPLDLHVLVLVRLGEQC